VCFGVEGHEERSRVEIVPWDMCAFDELLRWEDMAHVGEKRNRGRRVGECQADGWAGGSTS